MILSSKSGQFYLQNKLIIGQVFTDQVFSVLFKEQESSLT